MSERSQPWPQIAPTAEQRRERQAVLVGQDVPIEILPLLTAPMIGIWFPQSPRRRMHAGRVEAARKSLTWALRMSVRLPLWMQSAGPQRRRFWVSRPLSATSSADEFRTILTLALLGLALSFLAIGQRGFADLHEMPRILGLL